MHGAGNDYIYINLLEERVDNPEELSRRLSDRHFGVGSDGLILIGGSEAADFSMRMFNVDGSEGEMCGNAARCVGKYVYDKKLTNKTDVSLETKSGIKILQLKLDTASGTVKTVRVNMGKPKTESELIPVITEKHEVINEPLNIDGAIYPITCVSMGNPHVVTLIDDVDALDIEIVGPKFENHPIFPQRVNTEFIQVIDRQTLKMRVWERGSGETLACGSGACASVVAAVLNGLCDTKVTVQLRGGNLKVEWDRTENVIYQTGGAEFVFEGEITLNS